MEPSVHLYLSITIWTGVHGKQIESSKRYDDQSRNSRKWGYFNDLGITVTYPMWTRIVNGTPHTYFILINSSA